MITNLANLPLFISRSRRLAGNIAPRVDDAQRGRWDNESLAELRTDVSEYFHDVAGYALRLGVLILIPLLIEITLLVRGQTPQWVCNAILVWLLLTGGLAMWVFFPVVTVVHAIRRMPEKIYRELLSIFWLNLDLLNIGIHVSLLLYVFLSWNLTTTLPIFALLALVWLFGPWVAYLAKLDFVYVYIRVGQLVLLTGVALCFAAWPVPASHYQSWAEREGAARLRPEEQREVTAHWESLQWFTQEGKPNVWYSADTETGSFRLFSSPGFDPATNQKLQPVDGKETRDLITNWLRHQKSTREGKQQVDEQKRDAAERAQAERTTTEEKNKLLHAYVLTRFIDEPQKNARPAIIVLDEGGQHDFALADDLAAAMQKEGLEINSSVFTPSFVQSVLFNKIAAGDFSQESKFLVGDYASALLIIRISTAISHQTPVKDVEMLAADEVCRIQCVSVTQKHLAFSTDLKARGTGFSEETARKNAHERIQSELAKAIPSLVKKLSTLR